MTSKYLLKKKKEEEKKRTYQKVVWTHDAHKEII
jgi:hypothetical protein